MKWWTLINDSLSRMNKFSLCVAVLQLGAAIEALLHGNYKLAGLWACYSIASLIMAFQ